MQKLLENDALDLLTQVGSQTKIGAARPLRSPVLS